MSKVQQRTDLVLWPAPTYTFPDREPREVRNAADAKGGSK